MCKLIQEQGIIMVSFLQPDAGAWMVCLLIAVHKFDAICFSEINLDSSVAPDDNNLDISGYNLVQPAIVLTISVDYTIQVFAIASSRHSIPTWMYKFWNKNRW